MTYQHTTSIVKLDHLTEQLRKHIRDLWWQSVQATHLSFVPAEYLDELYHQFYGFLDDVDLYGLYVGEGAFSDAESIIAFVGVSGPAIEMLFVHPRWMGCGVGSSLLRFALNTLRCRTVTVNEGNERAVAFYRKHGLTRVTSRSDLDAIGRPYPTLTLCREQEDQ